MYQIVFYQYNVNLYICALINQAFLKIQSVCLPIWGGVRHEMRNQ